MLSFYPLSQLLLSTGRGTSSSSEPARLGSAATGRGAEGKAAHGTETRGQLAPLRSPRPPRHTRCAGHRERSGHRGPHNESAHREAAQTARTEVQNQRGPGPKARRAPKSPRDGPALHARAAPSRSGPHIGACAPRGVGRERCRPAARCIVGAAEEVKWRTWRTKVGGSCRRRCSGLQRPYAAVSLA